MMSAQARAAAILAGMKQANPNMVKLSAAEQQALQTQLQVIYGADLTYTVANMQVNPGGLAAPAGASVSTTGSAVAQTGVTTSAVGLTGVGTVS